MIKPVLILGKLAACLLIAALFFLSACKKDKSQQPVTAKNTSLFGQWYTSIKDTEKGRYLIFASDSSFLLTDVEYKNGKSTAVMYTGKFHTKENNLVVVIAKKTVSKDSDVISTEPSDAKFYVNSTFTVDDHKLTLSFADATGATVNNTFMMLLPDKVI
ncbi:hypothetical protein SNE26_05500 [Mucilaginibacter sp. cycad4]|uniref:hypothetical protein n=1 Tax=Mucilaginibacter sp. cycad4 TaxID=3342096 RepID=UPI002AAB31AD|nr:hypothetical protein [Mucilaginibacter gossypii]WPV01220.1 hypothetical protein SNE26_05500 [Mucilaginibacter gossypii]